MKKVFLYSADKKINLQRREQCKNLIEFLIQKEKKKLDKISYIFCSDEYLRNININFLKHDDYTDVITFKLSENNEPINGEIYLSIERIFENAKLFGTSYQNELIRVLIHGALHLCDYLDNTQHRKSTMREKENYYLEHYRGFT